MTLTKGLLSLMGLVVEVGLDATRSLMAQDAVQGEADEQGGKKCRSLTGAAVADLGCVTHLHRHGDVQGWLVEPAVGFHLGAPRLDLLELGAENLQSQLQAAALGRGCH